MRIEWNLKTILVIILIVGALAFTVSKFFAITGGTVRLAPLMGTLTCEKLFSNIVTGAHYGGKGWKTFTCEDWTEKCSFRFRTEECATGTFDLKYKIDGVLQYQSITFTTTTPGGCEVRWTDDPTNPYKPWGTGILTINKGQTVEFIIEGFLGADKPYSVEKFSDVWGLVDRSPVIGTKTLVSRGCIVPTGATKVGQLSEYKKTAGTLYINQLGVEGIGYINYIADWVYAPAPASYSYPMYQGRQVLCDFGAITSYIYELFEIKTTDKGTFKLYGREFSGLGEGMKYITKGDFIKYVDCCPGRGHPAGYDMVCDDNFKWVAGAEYCDTSSTCSPSFGQYIASRSHYVHRQICSNHKCVWEAEKYVECTLNADCPAGSLCNTMTWMCESPPPVPYCGDGFCMADESYNNCCWDGKGVENPCTCPKDYTCNGTTAATARCVKGEVPANYCKSCFSWLWNKIKPGYCEEATTLKLSQLLISLAPIIAIVGIVITLFIMFRYSMPMVWYGIPLSLATGILFFIVGKILTIKFLGLDVSLLKQSDTCPFVLLAYALLIGVASYLLIKKLKKK